jgi:hypothetical protein
MLHAEKNGDLPIYTLIGDKEFPIETISIANYPIHNIKEPRILLVPESDEVTVWNGLP